MLKTTILLFILTTLLVGAFSACNDPGDVENSNRDLVGLEEGDTVNYTCNVGYKVKNLNALTVTTIRTCQNGNWSDGQPVCEGIQCSDPGEVVNSNKTVSHFGYQGTVTYTCDPGYRTPTGSRSVTLTCQDDELWNRNPPICNRVQCPAPEEIPDATHNYSNFLYNDVVTYTCNDGYEKALGNSTLRCNEIGSWDGTWPLCTRIICGDPGEVPYASRLLTGIRYESTVHYTCLEGFVHRPDSSPMNRTCEASGNWSGTPTVCQGSFCGKPNEPTNATRIPNDPTYRYPETVKYECDPGFSPNYTGDGVSEIACTKEGTWDFTPIKCSAIICLDDNQAVNAIVPQTNTYYGQNRVYQCKPGFKINDGSLVRACQPNGSLSGTAPVCTELNCTTLVDRPHADRVGDGNKFQDSVTYSCHNGYQIEGEANSFSRQLYCQADAEWSTSIPNCIPLDCGSPSTTSYLTVVSQNGSGYQDSIEVECAPGYDYVSGNLTRTCQADGKWNGQTPVCIPVSCGDPPSKPHVTYIGSIFTYKSRVFYTCAPGYVTDPTDGGGTFQACLLNKTWGGGQGSGLPNCIPLTCYGPQQIIGATLLNDSSHEYIYGERISYSCNTGFEWDPESGPLERWCSENKQWSNAAPVCPRKSCGDPGEVEGTTRQVAGFLYRDTVNYTCKPGFQVDSGTVWSEITCQANQTWTGQYPSCKRIACPDPGLGEHATRVVGGLLFEDIIEYTCDEDYRVDSGIYKIECIETKTWSYPLPECVPVEGVNATKKVNSNMGPAVESESSNLIGKICIICMAVEFGTLAVLDMTTLWKDIRIGLKNIKHGVKKIKRRRLMTTGDRVSPLIGED